MIRIEMTDLHAGILLALIKDYKSWFELDQDQQVVLKTVEEAVER